MQIQDLKKIKYNDYIQLRTEYKNTLVFGRILDVNDPNLVYLEKSIIWVQIYPILDLQTRIKWNYSHILSYVARIIEHPNQKKLIKLLYDELR